MSRTIGTNLTTAIGKSATAPIYLIKMTFAGSPVTVLRYTTGPDVTILSQSWVHKTITVDGINWENKGRQTCTIRWNTNDLVALGLVGSNAIAGAEVEVYITERMASYSTDDALLVFSGVMDMAKITDGQLQIDCSNAGKQLHSPRQFYGPSAGFNHNSVPGVFYVGSTKVELRGRG